MNTVNIGEINLEELRVVNPTLAKQLERVQNNLDEHKATEARAQLSESIHDDVNVLLEGFQIPESFGLVITTSETGGFCVNLVLEDKCTAAINGKRVGGNGGGGNGGAWQANQYRVVATGEVFKSLAQALEVSGFQGEVKAWTRWRNVKGKVEGQIIREDYDASTVFADSGNGETPVVEESETTVEVVESETPETTETVEDGVAIEIA